MDGGGKSHFMEIGAAVIHSSPVGRLRKSYPISDKKANVYDCECFAFLFLLVAQSVANASYFAALQSASQSPLLLLFLRLAVKPREKILLRL